MKKKQFFLKFYAKSSILLILLLVNNLIYAQIGINTTKPDPSSVLDVVSNTKGVLLPRLNTQEKLAVPNPADGLLVYDTTQNRFYVYDGDSAAWKRINNEDDSVPTDSSVANLYDIFLIAGQSNTHWGLGFDPSIDTSDPDIFQVGRRNGFDGIIIPAAEPLHHWNVFTDRIGFGLTFAKKYKQNLLKPGRKVLLVPCGYGGTSIEQWAKGGALYNDAIQRTIRALANNPGSKIMGILWHQGEANVGSSNYTTNLDNFIRDIRNDLGNTNIPIVLGGMVPYWVNLNANRIIQQDRIIDTPNRINKSAYADPTIPTIISKPNNSSDDIHYDAAGQRILGERYYNAFLSIQ